jgi:hypothetical protein
MRVSEAKMQYVVMIIERLVHDTGFPVATQVLTQPGLITRAELRKMARDKKIKTVGVESGGTRVTAYYTEGVIPNALQPERVTDYQP